MNVAGRVLAGNVIVAMVNASPTYSMAATSLLGPALMAVLCFVVFGHLERPHVVPPPLKEALQLFELAVDGPIVVEGLLSAPVEVSVSRCAWSAWIRAEATRVVICLPHATVARARTPSVAVPVPELGSDSVPEPDYRSARISPTGNPDRALNRSAADEGRVLTADRDGDGRMRIYLPSWPERRPV